MKMAAEILIGLGSWSRMIRSEMEFLNHVMISTIFGAPDRFYWHMAERTLLPVCVFITIGIICSYCKKWVSRQNRFALALIVGYTFLFFGLFFQPRSIRYDSYGHGVDFFLKSVMYACALGLALVCFRLRSAEEKYKPRFKAMYLLMLGSIVFLIIHYLILCT